MEIETLKTMNEGMYLSLLMMIEVIVLIGVFCAITGFAIYLAGVAWICSEETRQPARRQTKPAPEPPEPDEYDLLAVLAALDDGLNDSLANSVSHREPARTSSAQATRLQQRGRKLPLRQVTGIRQ
jgi:hypothetical protein